MSVWMCQPSAFRCSSLSPPFSPRRAQQSSSEPIHFLAQTITPVRMWLNHYQYVALLRMKDAMARLGAELGQHVQHAKQFHGQKTKSASVCVSLLVDSIEVGLLLPPASTEPEQEVPHTPETDSPSITDSDISPTHHSADVVLEDSGLENGTSSISTAVTAFDHDEQDEVVEEACEAMEEGLEVGGSTTQGDAAVLSHPLSPGLSPVLSRDQSTFSLEGELSSAINVTKDVTKDAISASLDLTKGAFSITKDAFNMLSRGSGMNKLFSPQAKEQIQRSEESSPSLVTNLSQQAVKQSPSQHSFDSANLDGSLPDENLSVDSDASENFVVHMESESGMEPVFSNNPSVPVRSQASPAPGTEGGSSVDLSSSLSQSTEDVTQDMSSVLLLILSGIACIMKVKGENQLVTVEAQNLRPVQMGNVRVSDLLAGVIQAPAGPIQKHSRLGNNPAVCMRAEMGPSVLADSTSFMEVKLQDCEAELLASTVANIGPFLEDEFGADNQPMKLYFNNITISVKDDGPRIYPTAPQPVPSTFIVEQLLLERSDDGILRLKSTEPKDTTGVSAVTQDNLNSSCCVQQHKKRALETQLGDARAALTQALDDRARLLQEVRKYDPTFTL